MDTSAAAGKAFPDVLGVLAEFETSLRRERQMEGLAAAKERGVDKGQGSVIDAAEVRRLHDVETLSPSPSRDGSGSPAPACTGRCQGPATCRASRQRRLDPQRDVLLADGTVRAGLLPTHHGAPKLHEHSGGRDPCPTRPLPRARSPAPR